MKVSRIIDKVRQVALDLLELFLLVLLVSKESMQKTWLERIFLAVSSVENFKQIVGG